MLEIDRTSVPLKSLVIERFGWAKCKHRYVVVPIRGRVILRCAACGQETETFQIAGETTAERREA